MASAGDRDKDLGIPSLPSSSLCSQKIHLHDWPSIHCLRLPRLAPNFIFNLDETHAVTKKLGAYEIWSYTKNSSKKMAGTCSF
jgi:hypothetical protein